MKPNPCCLADSRGINRDFNLLENILAFCAAFSWGPFEESGVKMTVSPAENSPSICVVFRTDHQSLTTGQKPDFLCVYLDPEKCIFTYIELKGGDVSDAIDQIASFHRLLKSEMHRMTPSILSRIRYQGIVLHVTGANIPAPKLERARKSIWIEAVSMNGTKAVNLFEFVSRIRDRTSKKPGASNSKGRVAFNLIEQLLVKHALDKHLNDAVHQVECNHKLNRDKVFLNYVIDSARFALSTDVAKMEIISCSGVELPPQVQDDLRELRLAPPLLLRPVKL